MTLSKTHKLRTKFEIQQQQAAPQIVKPFTVDQLVGRANRSTQDYLSKKFKSQEQLEKESENYIYYENPTV